MAIHDTFPDQGRKNPIFIKSKVKVKMHRLCEKSQPNIACFQSFHFEFTTIIFFHIEKIDSRVISVDVSGWEGQDSKRGIGGDFPKCDQPDPKLLVRRPLRITLALQSGSGKKNSWKKRVGRSLKFHEDSDEIKVYYTIFKCCCNH